MFSVGSGFIYIYIYNLVNASLNWYISVGMVTRLWAGWFRFFILSTPRALQNVQTGSRAHPALNSLGTCVSSSPPPALYPLYPVFPLLYQE
jgi:hypothetical protein